MKLTKSQLKRLIKEELQKVIMQEQCPPGMTQQGNQCVGQPGAYKKPTITQTRTGVSQVEDKPARSPYQYARRLAAELCTLGWSISNSRTLYKQSGGRWTARQLAATAKGTNGRRYGLSKMALGTHGLMSPRECKKLVGGRRTRRAKPMSKWQCAKICAGQDQAACKKCMQATG